MPVPGCFISMALYYSFISSMVIPEPRLGGALNTTCCTNFCSLCPAVFSGIGPGEPVWLVGLRKVQKGPFWNFFSFPCRNTSSRGILSLAGLLCRVSLLDVVFATLKEEGGHTFPFPEVCTLRGIGVLPGCKESQAFNSCPSNPSPLPLHKTQSRLLCSAQSPGCLPAELGRAQPILCCLIF